MITSLKSSLLHESDSRFYNRQNKNILHTNIYSFIFVYSKNDLYFVSLFREEHRQYASKRISQGKRDKSDITNNNQATSDDELPPSIAILFSSHEFLGKI